MSNDTPRDHGVARESELFNELLYAATEQGNGDFFMPFFNLLLAVDMAASRFQDGKYLMPSDLEDEKRVENDENVSLSQVLALATFLIWQVFDQPSNPVPPIARRPRAPRNHPASHTTASKPSPNKPLPDPFSSTTVAPNPFAVSEWEVEADDKAQRRLSESGVVSDEDFVAGDEAAALIDQDEANAEAVDISLGSQAEFSHSLGAKQSPGAYFAARSAPTGVLEDSQADDGPQFETPEKQVRFQRETLAFTPGRTALDTASFDRLQAKFGVEGAVSNDAVLSAMESAMKGEMLASDGMGESVREGMGESVREGMGESVREGMGESGRERMGESGRERMGESVREGMGESVRERMGESVRGGMGESTMTKRMLDTSLHSTPLLALDVDSIDYGDVVEKPLSRSICVASLHTHPLHLVATINPSTSPFTLTTQPSLHTLLPESSVLITLTYTPISDGEDRCELILQALPLPNEAVQGTETRSVPVRGYGVLDKMEKGEGVGMDEIGIQIPKHVTFGDGCVVGTSSTTRLPVMNMTSTSVSVSVTLIDDDSCFGIGEDTATIAPLSAHIFDLFFTPLSSGKHTCCVEVSSDTHAVSSEVEGTAEDPRWRCSPSDGDVVEFGTMSYDAAPSCLPIHLYNHGHAPIRLSAVILESATDTDWSFHVAAPNQLPPSPSLSLPPPEAVDDHGDGPIDGFVTLLPSEALYITLAPHSATTLWIRFTPVSYEAWAQVNGGIGIVREYRDHLHIRTVRDHDTADLGTPPAVTVDLVATVGAARLQVPRDAQRLVVRDGESVKLPLRNAGSVPLHLALSTDEDRFIVTPASLVIAPLAQTDVSVKGVAPGNGQLVLTSHASTFVLPIVGEEEHVSPPPTPPSTRPSLVCDRPVVSFGAVGLGERLTLSLILRNSGPPVSVTMSIQGADAGFTIVGTVPSSAALDDHWRLALGAECEAEVVVGFAPVLITPANGALIMDTEDKRRFRIPLSGYGGTSHIVPTMPLINVGAVIDEKEVIVTLANTGDRCGVVACESLQFDGTVSIVPCACLIQAHDSVDMRVRIRPSDPQFHYNLEFVTCDDLARQRRREARRRRGKSGGQHMHILDSVLPGEDSENRDVGEYGDYYDEALFDTGVGRVAVGLTGVVTSHVSTPMPAPISTPIPTHVSEGSSWVGDSWVLTPKHLVISATSPNPTSSFLIINPTPVPIPYTITCPSPLFTHPNTGVAGPLLDVRVIVGLAPHGDEGLPPLPWRTAIGVVCNGVSRSVSVMVCMEKGNESVVVPKPQATLDTTVYTPLLLRTSGVSFNDTPIGATSISTLLIENVSPVTQSFTLTPVGPVIIDSAPYKHPVFTVHTNGYEVQARSCVEATVSFTPAVPGAHAQYWRFETVSSSHTSQVALHGNGVGDTPHSSPHSPPHLSPHPSHEGVYVKEDAIVFTPTLIGEERVKKVRVCNGSERVCSVSVVMSDESFVCRHSRIKIRARSYVLLPIHFYPKRQGASTGAEIGVEVGVEMTCVAMLSIGDIRVPVLGVGTTSPLLISQRPLRYRGEGTRDSVRVSNVSQNPIKWRASCTRGWSCSKKGSLEGDTSIDIDVVCGGECDAGKLTISADGRIFTVALNVV